MTRAVAEWLPADQLPAERWRLDGIEFNGGVDTDTGCEFYVTNATGWKGAPAVRASRQNVMGAHGAYAGPQWREGRPITLEGRVACPTEEARELAERKLAALCDNPSGTYTLVCTEALGDVRAEVVLNGETLVNIARGRLHLDFSLALYAPDPRKYLAEQSQPISLPTPGTGLNWQAGAGAGLDWSTGGGLDWGVPETSGAEVVVNSGTAETWPRYRLDGPSNGIDPPLVMPVISLSTGQQLPYSGTLLQGEFLLIDTHPLRRSVLLNGTTRRRSLLSNPQWAPLLPGSTTTVAFTAASYSPSSRLTVSWSPALA
ncbi:hypothetical protein JOF41_007381 [Saccharothrix coeruleofusca]|uniref:hypothetical protein n=1 Tax=Saccharothrix coeruleofusca TaxID=33919 RepID=UPI001AE43A9F|nr:hypothetical protein [Saccharothrix coeruleofusca]MBP2341127.1 hypothetical protein [Saccharothrix coeruleofusca]